MITLFKSPLFAKRGHTIGHKLTLHVRNVGNKTAGPFYAAIVLSKNTQITNTDPRLLGFTPHVSGLGVGQTRVVQISNNLRVPSSTPLGKRYIGVLLDPANKVKEKNEVNNTRSRTIQILP